MSDPSLEGEKGVDTLHRFVGNAPDWALRLRDRIVADFLPEYLDEVPAVAFVPTNSTTRFGGRHYPDWNAIAVYDSHDPELTKSVEVHEMCHWVRKRTGDPDGKHDEAFFKLLGVMYERYGVERKLAVDVEPLCKHCETDWRW